MKSKNYIIENFKKYMGLLVGLLILIIFCLVVPNFFSYGNFYSTIIQVSILSIFALGVCFVGILKEFDLSIGATASLCSTFLIVFLNKYQVNFVYGVVLAIIIALICGFMNGFLVIEIGISAIIATIGTSSIFYAFETLLNSGNRVVPSGNNFLQGDFTIVHLPFVFIFSLITLAILHFFSLRTTIGRSIYATGENKIAARFSGLRTKKYGYICFIAGALLGAIGGILQVTYTGTAQLRGGDKFLWDAFMAYFIGMALFGGKRLFIGAYLGCILSVLIGQVLFLLGLPIYSLQLLKALFLVLAIVIGSVISLRRGVKIT